MTVAGRRILRRGALAAGLALAWAAAAAACESSAPSAIERWRAVTEHGRAWLVPPAGDRFFSLGVNVLDGGKSLHGIPHDRDDWWSGDASLPPWAAQVRERLQSWGFNSAGAWSLPPQILKLPEIVNLELGRTARFHWFDPFDPKMPEIMCARARELVGIDRGSVYRIGYFPDNEVGWWGGALFSFYAMKPAANFTKQRLVQLLKSQYGGQWSRFTADFEPPAGVASWNDLLASERPTRLRPGGRGVDAVRRWTGIVAAHYYRLVRDAIRAADPGSVIFSDRLPIYYDPDAIRAAAPYVDAIATNYNIDSPEGWIAPYYFAGLRALTQGKPVLVSEWFFAANENRTGNVNNGHLMTVATQAERARGAAAATRAFARIPELLGLHWFQYYDDPKGGRRDGEDYDFGLVDSADRPYEELTAALSDANRAVPGIHARAAPASAAPVRKPFLVPKAEIDPAHASLIDWPKPQSLLPPLKAAPGEVPFGEIYLSWSARGLALATIGQDYYDVGLLAYASDFPLSEAYRVELDVDAGAGARRFTYYFIPPRTKAKDHPPMAPLLCRGAPAEHAPTSCPEVGGATALYFGADQPRIAAEAVIPWQELGLAGPPPDGKLKLEVSSAAWFRSRWMSLSGLAPALGSAHPERWREMRLAQ